MKKPILAFAIFFATTVHAQNIHPRIELYAAPGFFLEQLNNDSLIPPDRRMHSRLGDIVSYGMQYRFSQKNKRLLLKTGIGFSERNYSLNKYSLDGFFVSLFSFGLGSKKDTFAVAYVKLTNRYLQIPVSVAWLFTRPDKGKVVTLSAGINFHSDFLLKSKARIDTDSSYYIPSAEGLNELQDKYTSGATKYVLTAEPYFETSINIYKGIGFYTQFSPFSFYASKLNQEYTSSTFNVFNFSFGLFYNFNNKR